MSQPILVDTTAAATFAGVRPGTIRQWARRHGLTRYGTRMRALYDLRELEVLLSDTPGTSTVA